ncbi:hypothetical protein QVD17_19709 [Tagetes erecta]|uniref:Uncharacterized protein n=1 Tax=Tagetes erecta TaxID=13708 RepID=A0AAD8NQB9_TARER|nr:hypothetical protein QVD17_19709 [Tagetes erecta]
MDQLEEVFGATVGKKAEVKCLEKVKEVSSNKVNNVSSKVKASAGAFKSKVVSKGKGKAQEVVQKVSGDGKVEDDDVFVLEWRVFHGYVLKKPSTCCEILRNMAPLVKRKNNVTFEDETLMANVIVHAAKLASSFPNEVQVITAERDELLGKHRGMLKHNALLESHCKAVEEEVVKIKREKEALELEVKGFKKENMTLGENMKKVEQLSSKNHCLVFT